MFTNLANELGYHLGVLFSMALQWFGGKKLQPPMACHALVTAFDLQMRPQHGDWMQRTDGRDDRVGEFSFKIPIP